MSDLQPIFAREIPLKFARLFEGADCEVTEHPFGYRSIHYLIKSKPDKETKIVELQVRTIFEEGWSEIDHIVRYPRASSDPFLANFLTIFNRLAGNADEMGTFIKGLGAYLQEQRAKVAGHEARLAQKEQELKETISKLKVAEEVKKELQDKVDDFSTSTFDLTIGASTFVDLTTPIVDNLIDAGTIGGVNSWAKCSVCGHRSMLFGGSPMCSNCSFLESSGLLQTCSKCGKKYRSMSTLISSRCPSCGNLESTPKSHLPVKSGINTVVTCCFY